MITSTADMVLIKQDFKEDDYGVRRPVETRRTVVVEVASVTRSEFSQAGQIGIRPEHEVDLFTDDWDGEETVELFGRRYRVYHTYQTNPMRIKLYLAKEK